MAKALIVEILADAKQFGRELDKAAGKTRSMGKVAGVAGLALAGGLALGLEKSVKAASDMQVSAAKMDQAFRSSHDNIGKYTKAIDDAESSGRNLGFSNVDIRDSLGSLEIATHNGTKAIRDLGIAENIARFKHIGLADASKVLTMAMAGSQRATKQLGLSLQPVTKAEDRVKAAFKDHSGAAYAAALATAKLQDKQATAAQVIDLVSHKLHGQAQAFAETAQGGVAKLHAQTEALEENLGSALLPALTAIAGELATVTGWLAKHTTVAKILIAALGALAVTLLSVSVAEKAITAATKIQIAVTKAWTAAQWILNAALDANPIGIVVVALAALAVAFKVAWDHSATFRRIVRETWGDIKAVTTAVVDFLKPYVVGLFKVWKLEANTAKTVITHLWDGVRAAWNATIGAAIRDMISLIKTLISWVEKAIGYLEKLSHIHIPNPFHKGGSHVEPGPINPGPGGGMASGGIVTRPIFTLVGEAGPEAVIPLSKMGRMGMGSGSSVTVNVGPIYGTADAGFARTLSTQLATQLRNGGAPQLQQAIKAL